MRCAADHLHDVARSDVVLGCCTAACSKLCLAELRNEVVGDCTVTALRSRQRDRRAAVAVKFMRDASRPCVYAFGLQRGRRGRSDTSLPAEIVEHRPVPRSASAGCRACGAHRPCGRGRQTFFDVTNRVVAEIADQPAGEARQPGHRRSLEARLEFGDERQRVGQAVFFHHLAVGFHRQQMPRAPATRCAPAGR